MDESSIDHSSRHSDWHILVMNACGVALWGDFVFQPERWRVFLAYGAALSIATTIAWSMLILRDKRL